jgi:hypothetical protein
MAQPYFFGSVGAHNPDRDVGKMTNQVMQQIQGRLISPVKVIKEQAER